MKEIHVEINESAFRRGYRLAAWWVEPAGYAAVNFQIVREIAEGADLPYMEFESRGALEDFLRPFVRLAERLGIAGDAAAVLQGELKATKYHLEDMRILAKVKKEI
jgi:diphthamide synthase (EF-2-diphthine--ammonia ligase)